VAHWHAQPAWLLHPQASLVQGLSTSGSTEGTPASAPEIPSPRCRCQRWQPAPALPTLVPPRARVAPPPPHTHPPTHPHLRAVAASSIESWVCSWMDACSR
jgi:hypothetical protein